MFANTGRRIIVADSPRNVSLAAQLQALFGGTLNSIGWIFMAAGLLFSAFFAADSEWVTGLTFRGELKEVSGTIVAVESTNMSENEEPILAVRYKFELDGREYNGTSYAMNAPFDPGDKVPIEYIKSNPNKSRVRGMRVRPWGTMVVMVLIFPLIGFILVMLRIPTGVRSRRLLRNGILAYGQLISQEATNAEVNEQTVYKLTFGFSDPRGASNPQAGWGKQHRIQCKTHLTANLTDEAHEPLLFNPDNPDDAVMLDGLPGGIDFDENGHAQAPAGRTLLVVLAPIATVLSTLLFVAKMLS